MIFDVGFSKHYPCSLSLFSLITLLWRCTGSSSSDSPPDTRSVILKWTWERAEQQASNSLVRSAGSTEPVAACLPRATGTVMERSSHTLPFKSGRCPYPDTPSVFAVSFLWVHVLHSVEVNPLLYCSSCRNALSR